jgi:very-short-patch-repair endonuclease
VTLPHRPYSSRLRSRARSLRRDPSPAEKKLWFDFLRTLPQKFTRQKPLGRFIADFYCSGRKLVIELDGDTHFSASAEHYDAVRTAELARAGIRVIRFTNEDVLQRFEGVCSEIANALET